MGSGTKRRRARHTLNSGRSITAFQKWLAAAGAEVQAPTSNFEIVRFRCSAGLSIIYRNSHGRPHAMTGRASDAWAAFVKDQPCPVEAAPTGWIGDPDTRPVQMTTADLIARAAAEPLTIAFVMDKNAMPMREAANVLFGMERDGLLERQAVQRGGAMTWRPAGEVRHA